MRPWRPSDATAVTLAFDCPDIQRWHVRRMGDHEEALGWIAKWATGWTDEREASWAIVGGDDEPIGQIGLRTISMYEGSAQLSYWVQPAARGKGVAVQAAQTLTRWSFETLGLYRLFLTHSTANLASCRVASKAGFPAEAHHRGAMRHADGWHDAHIHALLRTEMAVSPGKAGLTERTSVSG